MMKTLAFCKTTLLLFISVIVISLTSCDGIGGNNNEPENFTGTWGGPVTDGTTTWGISFSLANTGSIVTGTFITTEGEVASGRVNGSYNNGKATLRLYSGDTDVAVISLDFTDDEKAIGTYTSNVSGFSGTITLNLRG
jgi:uncharacterized lipoprotein YehR (DUF1307 family)